MMEAFGVGLRRVENGLRRTPVGCLLRLFGVRLEDKLTTLRKRKPRQPLKENVEIDQAVAGCVQGHRGTVSEVFHTYVVVLHCVVL